MQATAPDRRWARPIFGALLLAAVALPLAVVAANALFSWRQAWREAEIEVERGADAAAEYAGRVLDTHRLLVERVDDLLRNMPDSEIRDREAELHVEMGRLLGDHPGLSGFVIDREGIILVAASVFPAPHGTSFADREFHVALRQPDAPETHVSRILLGRTNGALFFAVSRRRTATGNGRPPGEFDGIVNVSVYPRDLATALRRIRANADDVVVLARSDGEILARSSGLREPLPPIPPGAPLAEAMARGEARTTVFGPTAVAEGDRLTAARRVAGWPIYAVVTRPRAAVVARWRELLATQLPVGALATALIAALALIIRRQQQTLRGANAALEQRVLERTEALAASEERLRLAQDAARIGTWEIDPTTWGATVNATQAVLYGLSPDRAPHGFSYSAWLAHLHPDDRGRVEAAVRACVESGASYEDEFRIHRSDTGEERWIHARGRWIRSGMGAPPRFAGVNIDITERKASEGVLAASEAEFRAIFENSMVGKAQADPATLRFVRVNAAYCEITGYDEAELLGGMTFADVTHPDERVADEAAFRAAMAEGRTYRVEKRVLRKDGEIRWVIVSVALLPPLRGRPARTIAAIQDITERYRAEERQTLLAREVDHRSKNALAVVQAALRLTPKADAADFASAVEGRVGALARAQTLLAEGRWAGADLRSIVEAELAGFIGAGAGAPRVVIEGPPLAVTAEAAQPVSMALHELATNATKYGALSVSRGAVRIAWAADPGQGVLRLRWTETGGPPVAGPPPRRGFGSRVIEATVRQIGGTLRQAWRPEGLDCDVVLPLARVSAQAARTTRADATR